eukprot:s2313_g3.t1
MSGGLTSATECLSPQSLVGWPQVVKIISATGNGLNRSERLLDAPLAVLALHVWPPLEQAAHHLSYHR